jgi:hypothetical protein
MKLLLLCRIDRVFPIFLRENECVTRWKLRVIKTASNK